MRRFLKKLGRCTAAILTAAVFTGCAAVGAAYYFTPDRYHVVEGSPLTWKTGAVSTRFDSKEVPASAAASQSYRTKLMLFDKIPVKTVYVDVVDETSVLLCGTPFGIKMFTDGVMVVGMADIQTQRNTVNPAVSAGMKVGDIILEINGKHVNQNEEVAEAVMQSGSEPLEITYKRNDAVATATLKPALSCMDNCYKAGLWVRDSTAGIGTLTFYDPLSKRFGGLGHGICDTDTNEMMPLLNGEVVPVSINGINKGRKGTPGELRGYFSTDIPMGTLLKNVQQGVYGTIDSDSQTTQFVQKPVHVAMRQEVQSGKAQILSTVDASGPRYYDIEIENLNLGKSTSSKDMIIRVTDPALLNATGGIVQGMSGSPILQNGKLVGAVTHVFVNDPTRGYGIYAESMLGISKQNSLNWKNETQEKAS